MNIQKLTIRCGILLLALTFAMSVRAQNGTAPNGYYPPTFSGSVFTGTVESTGNDQEQITLVYKKGSKTERFVGRLKSACTWKGKPQKFSANGIAPGTVLTAFYESTTKKSDGQKTKENTIFAVSFVEMDGKRIPEDKRMMVYCTEQQYFNFKVF